MADVAKTEVGAAYATIIPSAKGFARNLKKEIAREFAGSGLDKAVADGLGNSRIKLDVDPVVDTSRLDRVGAQPVRLPVTVDGQQAAREATQASRRAERAAPPVRLKVNVDSGSVRAMSGLGRLASAAGSALGGLMSSANGVGGAVMSMTSGLRGLLSGLLALGAATSVAISGTYLLGGALGALPGLITGALAGIAALAIGLIGLGEAFEDAGGGGGGGGAGMSIAAQARQIAQATRGVESAQRSLARAQRDVVQAQEAVTRARLAEQERLEDLDRAVRRARLDEEDAALRVREAERDLALARRSGNVQEIARAELAYRQALLSVEDAKDATEDLGREQEEAARKGVDGSDQVQQALRRQADAVDALISANEQLQSAEESLAAARERPGGGGGGGAAEDMMELAPAAQRFVDAIKALGPAFERLRLNVQQKLFAGLDVAVKRLATAWFPQLNRTLGDYADTFNGLAKRAVKTMTQKSFIDNMAAGAESARKMVERLGKALTGPFLNAFGKLSRAAGPFIEQIGESLAGLFEDFSDWIDRLDKSGGLDRFFKRAGEVFDDLIEMGKDLGSIFGSVMTILFDREETTNSPWTSLRDGLDDLAKWFKDPQNQEKVREFIDDVTKFFTEDIPAAHGALKDTIDTVSGWLDTIEQWRQRLDAFRQQVRDAMSQAGAALRSLGAPITWALGQFTRLRDGAILRAASLLGWLRGLPDRIRSALGNTGRMLYQAGRNIIQGLIDGIRERFPSLEGVISRGAQLIRDYFPYSPAKTGPLSGRGNPHYAGRSIVELLASGVTGNLGTAEAAAADLAGTFAGAGLPSGVGYTGAATPTPAGLTARWEGGDGDPIVRAIREHLRIYYAGSPAAAFGS